MGKPRGRLCVLSLPGAAAMECCWEKDAEPFGASLCLHILLSGTQTPPPSSGTFFAIYFHDNPPCCHSPLPFQIRSAMPWLLLAPSPLNPFPERRPPPRGFGGPCVPRPREVHMGRAWWHLGDPTAMLCPPGCAALPAATPARLGTPQRRAVTPHPLAAITRRVLAPETNLPGSLRGA